MERKRWFEIAKGFEDKNINMPVRKTKYSAGYDIEAAEDCIIPEYKPCLLYTSESENSFFIPCFFYKIMGIKCPGCGMTRSLHNLVNGDIKKAIWYLSLIHI